MAALPEYIGEYKVIRELGRGAMGVVYLAVHPTLHREMAIKVMGLELASDPEFLERFRREGVTAASLRHPNIIQVYDFAHRDGRYFIAMEYLGSRTLKDLLGQEGQQPVALCCEMMDDLLSALALAHGKGIVHRDIKPANIMLTDAGPIALTDFSVAHMKESSKLTQTGAIIGTPEYMAPEQFEGRWDARSDLYSAGIVFYELLTGFSPFRSNTITEVMRKQLLQVPDPPSAVDFTLPESISQVVCKVLEKDPDLRYQSAQEMREAIKAARAVPTPSLTPPARDTIEPNAARTKVESASIPATPAANEETLKAPPASQQKQETLPVVPDEGLGRRQRSPFVTLLILLCVWLAFKAVKTSWRTTARSQEAGRDVALRATPTPPPPVSPEDDLGGPPPTTTSTPAVGSIEPGQSVGPVDLGDSPEEVAQVWGHATQKSQDQGFEVWTYGPAQAPRVKVKFDDMRQVESLEVFSKDYLLTEDAGIVAVGTPFDVVVNTLGEPDRASPTLLEYASLGLEIRFPEAGANSPLDAYETMPCRSLRISGPELPEPALPTDTESGANPTL